MASLSRSLPATYRAIRVLAHGTDPSAITFQTLPLEPLLPKKESDYLVKVEYAGINFIDTYQRSGLYPPPSGSLPFTLGVEGAGTVVLSSPSSPFSVGQRVAIYGHGLQAEYFSPSEGSVVVPIPEGVSTKQAATSLVQGLTAISLVTEAHEAKKGEWVLVHAAAGGTGSLLVQILKAKGVHVVGTCSTEEKAEVVRRLGADHVFVYGTKSLDDLVPEIKAVTPNGEGFHAILDGVGKSFVEANFELIRRKGSFVTYGNASGAVPPIAPLRLAGKNVRLSRPKLNNFIVTQEEQERYANELWALIKGGNLKLGLQREEGYEWSEEGVRLAQSELEARKTKGKLIVKIDPEA